MFDYYHFGGYEWQGKSLRNHMDVFELDSGYLLLKHAGKVNDPDDEEETMYYGTFELNKVLPYTGSIIIYGSSDEPYLYEDNPDLYQKACDYLLPYTNDGLVTYQEASPFAHMRFDIIEGKIIRSFGLDMDDWPTYLDNVQIEYQRAGDPRYSVTGVSLEPYKSLYEGIGAPFFKHVDE